jgi:hypothetical protein
LYRGQPDNYIGIAATFEPQICVKFVKQIGGEAFYVKATQDKFF